jgi:hypothetical protein
MLPNLQRVCEYQGKRRRSPHYASDEPTVGSGTKNCGGGFAHRFRPTYAGANVGHPCGAVGPVTGLRKGLRYPISREKRARCPEFPVRSSG